MERKKLFYLFSSVICLLLSAYYYFFITWYNIIPKMMITGFSLLISFCSLVAFYALHRKKENWVITGRYIFLAFSVIGSVVCLLFIWNIFQRSLPFLFPNEFVILDCFDETVDCRIKGFGEAQPFIRSMLYSVPVLLGETGVYVMTRHAFKLKKLK